MFPRCDGDFWGVLLPRLRRYLLMKVVVFRTTACQGFGFRLNGLSNPRLWTGQDKAIRDRRY